MLRSAPSGPGAAGWSVAWAARGRWPASRRRFIRRDPSHTLVLRINYFGSAGYAPLLQMRERRHARTGGPGLSIEWKAIPDVGSINDALANGGLDVASGPPRRRS